jgi:hypothetical protein
MSSSPEPQSQNDIKIQGTIAPLSFYHSYDNLLSMDNGNRALLPKFMLNQLSNYDNLCFPLTIMINETIIGVHEIMEDIDCIYIPSYICNKLNIYEPTQMEIAFIDNSKLSKAEFIKLKPHQSKFYEIMDTKSFLENNIKTMYTHIEKNQTIMIPYDNTVLYFDVIETKPADLVSLNDTDVEVDFEQAHDYVEPKPVTKVVMSYKFKHGSAPAPTNDDSIEQTFVPFSGHGRKLGDD